MRMKTLKLYAGNSSPLLLKGNKLIDYFMFLYDTKCYHYTNDKRVKEEKALADMGLLCYNGDKSMLKLNIN